MVKVEFDFDALTAKLTDLEKRGLPAALSRAMNDSAFQVRDEWRRVMPHVFDRPTPLTLNAVLVKKGNPQSPAAEVFIRDEANKGTPPSEYLRTEAAGGARYRKGSERLIGRYWVAGKGARLDQYGNVPGSVITAILSDIRAHPDSYSRSTPSSRKKRARRKNKRGGQYFVVTKRQGKLRAGVYERINTGFGSAVRTILFFVPRAPQYRKRFDALKLATDIFEDRFKANFYKQLTLLARS